MEDRNSHSQRSILMFNKLHLHYIRIRSEILAVNVVIEKIFKDVLFKSILCLPSCSCSYSGNPILGLNNLEKYTINVLFFVSLQRFLREIFYKKQQSSLTGLLFIITSLKNHASLYFYFYCLWMVWPILAENNRLHQVILKTFLAIQCIENKWYLSPLHDEGGKNKTNVLYKI